MNKKFDFSNRHNIQAICLIIMLIVTSILCMVCPIISHADTPKIKDYWYIKDYFKLSDAISHNGETGFYNVDGSIFTEPTIFSNSSSAYYDALKSIWDCSLPSSQQSNYNLTVYVDTSNQVKVIFQGRSFAFDYDGTTYVYSGTSYIAQDSPTVYSLNNDGSSLTLVGYLDGGTYKRITDFQYLLYTTLPIYFMNNNLNYLTLDNKAGFGSDGFGVTPSYPDESAENNMFMEDTDFRFTHQTYYAPYSSAINTGSYYPIGVISFTGQPNDYQIQHPEEFSLAFDFSFQYDVDYKNKTGTEFGYFKKTGSIMNNSKNLKLNFATGSSLVLPYFVSLSTFIQNKNSCDFVIKDVFDSMTDSLGTSLTGVLAQSNEITELSYNNFKIYCNVCLVHNGDKSGHYEEWYNFNSKKGFTTDKTMNENPNPYVPNPTEQADDDPDSTNITPKPNVPGPGGSDDDSSGGTTTTTNGNGSIVINNNPTFNNNPSASANANANGGLGSGILPNLLSTLSNNQQASVDTIQNIANTNGWLNVVKDVYSFVPVTLWTSLIHYFVIAVTILIVGFVLSIIIKFIT